MMSFWLAISTKASSVLFDMTAPVGLWGLLCQNQPTAPTDNVVLLLDDYHLRIRLYHCLQFLNIKPPSVRFICFPEGHFRAQVCRYVIKLLISRIVADDMISFTKQAVEDGHVRSNCSGCNEDILCFKSSGGF